MECSPLWCLISNCPPAPFESTEPEVKSEGCSDIMNDCNRIPFKRRSRVDSSIPPLSLFLSVADRVLVDEQVRPRHADRAGVEDEAQEWPVSPILHVQRQMQVL